MKDLRYAALFLVLATLGYVAAAAQAPATRAAPTATPNVCDQAFSGVVEDADHNIVSLGLPGVSYALPWADVQDNHAKQVRVVAELAKQQNKSGEYTITATETNTCDGGNTVRVPSGSIYVEGVTLAGLVAVADVSIQVAKEVNDRYRDRANKGLKTGWNHKVAPKVQRDDAGQVIPPGQVKKSS